MPVFLRSDLIGIYCWTADGNNSPKLTGDPDGNLLDRGNGHEVLYLIRKIMEVEKHNTAEAGQEIELMIKLAPTDCQTQKEVMDWILSH